MYVFKAEADRQNNELLTITIQGAITNLFRETF